MLFTFVILIVHLRNNTHSETFIIIPSPKRVTPRAFFPKTIKFIKTIDQAFTKIFRSEGIIDPQATSFVENFPQFVQNFANGHC